MSGADGGPSVPVDNLLLSGGFSHPFHETTPALRAILAEVGVRSTVTEDLEEGIAALTRGAFAMVTVNVLRWRMEAERYAAHRDAWAFSLAADARRTLRDFVARGGALLAVHTAAICFDDWPEWREIVGGAWNWQRSSHPPLGPMTVRVCGGDHPIVAGLADFEIVDECYGFLDHTPEIVPLVTSSHGGAHHPLLWARRFGHGRVVYDALGHDARSYTHPTHAEILRRAAMWLTGRTNAL